MSNRGQFVKAVKMSLIMKKKNGWSRETGAGFIAEDIRYVHRIPNKTIWFSFGTPDFEDHRQILELRELNLRETEELLKFLESQSDEA